MAGRDGFKVEGLSRVVRELKALGLDVDDLKNAFSKLSALGAETAARHAPKKSGRLSGSVRGNRAQSKAVVVAGRAAVPYAGPINYGWPARNISASGFMQKTDEELRPQAVQLLQDEINAAARRRGLT
ncbi:hypothetical protein [Nocardioides marmoraquaticus]